MDKQNRLAESRRTLSKAFLALYRETVLFNSLFFQSSSFTIRAFLEAVSFIYLPNFSVFREAVFVLSTCLLRTTMTSRILGSGTTLI